MSTISLLILAAVAGFLFYQLRSVLGQTPYDAKEKLKNNPKKPSLYDRFSDKNPAPHENIPTILDTHNKFIKSDTPSEQQAIIEKLNAIKQHYTEFDIVKFIDGVKGAYDMIIEAFSKDMPQDLKNYLADDIYLSYQKLLEDYAQKQTKYQTIVTRIESVMITSVYTDPSKALITTEINASHISVLKDNEDRVVQGDPDREVSVKDIWTFERAHNSVTPAWIVIKTSV